MTAKIDREARKREQVERGVLELLRTSPRGRNWLEITSNMSASSRAIEECLDALQERGAIGNKEIKCGAWGRRTDKVYFLKDT